ncbi:MAG: CDP-diacylglycerol--glycerol-3-phosphate 3-phosphatidyltransferase [Acidimicrobiia bacterium]|nr:CDP-diacylglycerol--glycerol-3-phosphate 3-phosphatidyltransferase [Acidimicrobiia bacterium]MBT8213619.1 CDP-diacylglycerol--glycerol-3-phosphate 3-phosphatidyltransferase [Acidimicrobiia bacterium]NNF68197.1 CDP-diacylglycerol--glycerol-3-phosphate 3-phosphatidyltransferase [Acidimicrobiia bacterium]NNK91103.1 CDP-diacylglycerol--glycerol-3-phosphate 3-phosphatidyltransferase [Acidimicrobiia bacterium]
MNLPNLLAYTRTAAAPVVLGLIIAEQYGVAVVVFTFAAVTDFADGYLARRWQVTTVLGAFLDSVADKALVTGALVALLQVNRMWAWAAFVIIIRELAVMALRGVAAMDKEAIPPSVWGKLKAVVQFVAIGSAMVRPVEQWGSFYPDEWLMLIAIGVTVASGVDYFVKAGRMLRST